MSYLRKWFYWSKLNCYCFLATQICFADTRIIARYRYRKFLKTFKSPFPLILVYKQTNILQLVLLYKATVRQMTRLLFLYWPICVLKWGFIEQFDCWTSFKNYYFLPKTSIFFIFYVDADVVYHFYSILNQYFIVYKYIHRLVRLLFNVLLVYSI